MRSRLIQIKDLKVGDQIKTYHNNEVIFSPVVDIWNTEVQTEDRFVLEFTNGSKVRCSRNHPIMILTDAGIEQRLPLDLTEFDEVITDNGSCYLYSITNDLEDIEYIDIEVDDTHTFFTSASKNDQMILTHNSQGGVRGGCVQKDSFVEKIIGLEFNGMKFDANKLYKINGRWVNIKKEIKTLAYLGNDHERTAYLSSLFGQDTTIEETLDINS